MHIYTRSVILSVAGAIASIIIMHVNKTSYNPNMAVIVYIYLESICILIG